MRKLKMIIIPAMLLVSSYVSIAQIPMDKQLHFSAGVAISSASLIIHDNPYTSIGSSLVIGLAKEVLDSKQENNRFDKVDLAYTVAGGIAGYGLHKIGIPKTLSMGLGLGFIGLRLKL